MAVASPRRSRLKVHVEDFKSEVFHPLKQAVHGRLVGVSASKCCGIARDLDIDVREGLSDRRPGYAADGDHKRPGACTLKFGHPLSKSAGRVNCLHPVRVVLVGNGLLLSDVAQAKVEGSLDLVTCAPTAGAAER